MTQPENADAGETIRPATFGQKLDALIGIVGYQMPVRSVSGVYLSKNVLQISAAQFARKRTGNAPVSVQELCKIIDHFKIGRFVDYRVFEEPKLEGFIARLREAGIGTYGASQREQLCQILYAAGRGSDYKVRFSRIFSPFSQRGPLGFPDREDEGRTVLRSGGRVNIECEGPEGRNLIVFTADQRANISVLMPSLFAPDTRVAGRLITLPTARDLETFHVRSDPGQHRLYALWTDDQIAQIVREAVDPVADINEMDDATAGAILKLVGYLPATALQVAICEYVVKE